MYEGIEPYFDGKPRTYEIFKAVHDYLYTLGPLEVAVRGEHTTGIDIFTMRRAGTASYQAQRHYQD